MSRVCVHGLGYIGLPTAAVLATAGHDVTGFDTDAERLESLARGDIYMQEDGLESTVVDAYESGALDLSDRAEPAEYHLICVPTPLDAETNSADLSYVETAARTIRRCLRTGDTVILESTVPPATTAEVVKPILEASGMETGADFDLVYSPETVLPGNVLVELRTNDRIVGHVDGTHPDTAVDLYDSFVDGEIVRAPDATTAEFVKLAQNTFRDTNIALANELAMVADDYGIDSREAITLANRHPRVNLHDPGPGVGGHCLPIDPWFLGQRSDRLDLVARARQINDGMVDYIVGILAEEFPTTDSLTVAILGAAYKGNVADTRGSPGLTLARTLSSPHAAESGAGVTQDRVTDGGNLPRNGCTVRVHDSHVEDCSVTLSPLEETLSGADVAVVTTDHDEYATLDPDLVADLLGGDLVLDTRGVLDVEAWSDTDLRLRRL